MKWMKLPSVDPYDNLAVEEYLLKQITEEVLLLWQNDRTVVVGCHQNTLSEIDSDYVREHDIKVVRRISGGGAVYHDLGNINYSFLINNDAHRYFDFAAFTQPIIRLLANYGVTAELSGRNDLVIGGKKFSGNAQYAWHDRLLHHGTLMIDSDLSAVERVLTVSPQKWKSRGIASVRSRVTNLTEYLPQITAPQFLARLIEFMGREYPGIEEYRPTEEMLAGAAALRRDKYDTWDWNYGYSPRYTYRNSRRFAAGTVEIQLNVQEGIIREAKWYGDFFSRGDMDEMACALCGVRHKKEDIEAILADFPVEQYIYGISRRELVALIMGGKSPEEERMEGK